MASKLVDFLESQSYKKEFKDLMINLESKYGSKFFDISGIGKQLDTNHFAKEFFSNNKNTADTSIDSNSNVSLKNIIVFDDELTKPLKLIYSYYRLWKGLGKKYGIEYANEAVEKQLSGEIYINDFHGFATNKYYCYNYSTLDTAVNGIPKGIDAEVSLPTKYLNTYFEHLQLFCIHAGASSLGAVGLADLLLTVSAYVDRILTTHSDQHTPFGNSILEELNQLIGNDWGNISNEKLEEVKKFINSKTKEEITFSSDEACWIFIKEKLTNFVYFLNQPNRIIQSLFSNVSIFDNNFLDTLLDHYCIIDGDNIYRAKKENVIKLQDMFLEIMNNTMARRITTFPVLTACVSLDDDRNVLDEEFLEKMIRANNRFCMINFYGGKTSTLSSCCRLRSDKENKYFSTLSGAGTKIGSLGVCTINLPRLAKMSEGNIEKFKELIKENVTLGQRINDIKRGILKNAINKKMIPVYNLGYVILKTQYSTTGINGLYEALEILGYNMASDEGIEFAGNLLDFINECNDTIGDELKAPVNLEQIPAENVSVKLAFKDRLLGYNDKYDIYSNQFIPLTYTGIGSDILSKIRIQGALDKRLSGGGILHLNINENNVSNDTFKELIKATFKAGTIYFAFNKLLCVCADCGKVFTSNKNDMDAKNELCPVCGSSQIEHAIRIVGFIRKFSSFSEGRRKEVRERIFYDI